MIIKAEHENGFSGILYGKSSLAIFAPDGHEVLHTGRRSIHTKDELLEMLAEYPEFIRLLMEDKLNEC